MSNSAITDPLTVRQVEMICMLANGMRYEEIAKRLYISPNTVQSTLNVARDRADAKTMGHLTALCAIAELIVWDDELDGFVVAPSLMPQDDDGSPDDAPVNRGTYRHVYAPKHPNASTNGRILEHRLVMANHLGRPLLPGETVHHKNGIRDDNRIDNLELMTNIHPHGQRVEDVVSYAIEVLKRYKPETLV